MDIIISNLPNFKDGMDKSLFISRVSVALNSILSDKYKLHKPDLSISEAKVKTAPVKEHTEEEDAEKREENTALPLREPRFTFDQLVLDDAVMRELLYAVKFASVREKVYGEWGIVNIDPFPKLALNFHGPSGTGKTMAAQALANIMGKKIILASYAEIESKFHGDGPKNVKKLFNFALENDAVLFIDEADSLLSRRLTNVTQGSEQAINSMRSQLLIQIEQFSGVVIFATNLAENYDGAFVTRIKSIHFKQPDRNLRKRLWQKMLVDSLPLDAGVDVEKLSEIADICGRDIKNAVVNAAVRAAIDGDPAVTQQALEEAITSIIESKREVAVKGGALSPEEKKSIGEKIKRQLKKDAIRAKASLRKRGGAH